MEMLRKICGFHCDERLLIVSFLCGVAADGLVSSRWPLCRHTFWQAVCLERLVFPLLHFLPPLTVLASSSRRLSLVLEPWRSGATRTFICGAGRQTMASEATVRTALQTPSGSESKCDTTKNWGKKSVGCYCVCACVLLCWRFETACWIIQECKFNFRSYIVWQLFCSDFG